MLTEKDLIRFWEKVDKGDDGACWNWTAALNHGGYGVFGLFPRSAVKATHVSWNIHFGEIPNGLWVLHTCDNPSCVNPKHLFLGTAQDNMDDKVKKGRHAATVGERNKSHKLSYEKVLEIRQRYALGNTTYRELSNEFGVSEVQIGNIVRLEDWRGSVNQL